MNAFPLLAAANGVDAEVVYTIKVLSILALLGTLALGGVLYKNQHRWFGVDAEVPSDSSGGRDYGRMQTWVFWLGMVIVFAFFALAL